MQKPAGQYRKDVTQGPADTTPSSTITIPL